MPSQGKLIEELLDETVRARRRRLNVIQSQDARLLALKTVDAKLDRNIRALAVLGMDALDAAAQRLRTLTHAPTIDALVHVMAACAVQAEGAANHGQLLERIHGLYGRRHRSALRDAWWFYPIGSCRFDIHLQRLAAMLGSGEEEQRLLAVELVGRLGFTACGTKVQRLTDETLEGPMRRAGELALCRMSLAPKALRQRVQALSEGAPQDRLHALRLMAVSGQPALLSAPQLLTWTRSTEQRLVQLAWCLATINDPAAAHEAAMGDCTMDASLRARILALAGYPSGLIAVVREVSSQDLPASAAQLDALAAFLGDVPMEVSAKQIAPPKREDALRVAVLQAFRAAHIPVRNEAKTCEWTPQAMLVEPGTRHGRRLRFGRLLRPLDAGGVALDSPVLQMGPLMRQALYIEQSAQAGRPIGAGLSAYASARHQLDAIGISQWIGRAAVAA